MTPEKTPSQKITPQKTTNDQPPKAVKPSITSAPRIRQIYWCRFPDAACLESPEFWKRRPVIIFSKTNKLRGKVTVLPCSTADQYGNPNAFQIQSPFSEKETWVICDHIITVATSRLCQPREQYIPKISETDFEKITAKVFANLPIDK